MGFAATVTVTPKVAELVSSATGLHRELHAINSDCDNTVESLMIDATNFGPIEPYNFRRVSVIHRNGEGGGGENVTMRIYGSNFAQKQTTLANVQIYSAELTGGGIVTNANTNQDVTEARSVAIGTNFQAMLSNYRWIYITLQSGVAATAAANQNIEVCMES